MASYTDNFGLSKLTANDRMSDDDYKFSESDRDLIDAKLYLGAVGHTHDGSGVGIDDPDEPLGYTLSGGSGSLPAGTTVRYKYTYVDQFGSETAASPELSVTTPPSVAKPGMPVLASSESGGSLTRGSYFYALTAWKDTDTSETRMGTRAYKTINGSTGTVTISFPSLPSGADGFNIYRRSPGSNQFWFLASVDLSTATPPDEYVDDGSIADSCVRGAPSTNSTSSLSSIELSLPGATPSVPEGYTWKLYRTYGSAPWENSLVSWVVEETSEGSGVTLPTYEDLGGDTTSGMPPTTSQITGSPSKINMDDAAEVQGSPPPGMLTVPHSITFTYAGQVNAIVGDVAWVCPFDNAKIVSVTTNLGVGYSPATQPVIVDVNRYDASAATPVWESIFEDTPANQPQIDVGEFIGNAATPSSGYEYLVEGDALSVDIDQTGGGATPTDSNLMVNILMHVKDGSSTTSVEFS